jgi:hypothetical protein
MIDFGNLFRRAWEICWQNRWLFVLGILASLGSASGGNSTINYSFGAGDVGPEFEQQMQEFFRTLIAAWPYLLVGGIALFLFSLLLWLLRLAARGGLIAAAAELDGGPAAPAGTALGIGSGLRRGASFLPRLVGLDLLLYGPVILVIIIPLAVLFASLTSVVIAAVNEPGVDPFATGFGAGELLALVGVCLCLVACLAVLWQLFLAFLHPLAQRSIVLDGRGVIDAIRHGWQILARNFGDLLLLVLFLFVIGLIFGALIAVILVPLGLLLAVPTVFDVLERGLPTARSLLAIGIGGFLLGLLGQALRGIFVTYQSVALTLAYRRLTGKGAAMVEPEPKPVTPYQFDSPTEES